MNIVSYEYEKNGLNREGLGTLTLPSVMAPFLHNIYIAGVGLKILCCASKIVGRYASYWMAQWHTEIHSFAL